jgi:hypothetical protein
LFEEKRKQLQQLVGNLQLKDVKEDAAFQTTTQRVKSQLQLTPISFEEPVIKTHRQEQKSHGATFDNPRPHQKTVDIVTVDFPFTGSTELFNYSPSGHSISSSDTKVYQPGYGRTITLEVEVPQLDREAVIAKAKGMMQTTFSLINQANPHAEQWSLQMDGQIEAALQEKRTELLNFYR